MTGVNVHASCVAIGSAGRAFGAPPSAGVLLLGDSGAGKSDLALRLIAMGARLVADDRVELAVRRGRLAAAAPTRLRGLIEIRGLGIADIPYTKQVRVALAIRLVRKEVPRLPQHGRYKPPAPLILAAAARPPLIRIAAFEASAPAKIAAAVAAFEHGLLCDFVKTQ